MWSLVHRARVVTPQVIERRFFFWLVKLYSTLSNGPNKLCNLQTFQIWINGVNAKSPHTWWNKKVTLRYTYIPDYGDVLPSTWWNCIAHHDCEFNKQYMAVDRVAALNSYFLQRPKVMHNVLRVNIIDIKIESTRFLPRGTKNSNNRQFR